MIIGIDLGTTNSAAAIWRDGTPVLIPNALGDFLTPSAVSMSDNSELLTGLAARDRLATHPDRTATSFKRYMGTRQTARLNRRSVFSAEQLSGLILRSLKADAESFLGEEVDTAVITVPAYFNDRQRKATRRAGELAGLKVARLLNEPTAAALAFGIHDRQDREPFLVFDLGGGTFDVSIVETFEGIVEVRASAGDNRLGGDDFNDCLLDLVRSRLDPSGRLAKNDKPGLRERLIEGAEKTRRMLSLQDHAAFSLVIDGEEFTTIVRADEFEAHASGLTARLRDPVLRSLRDSGIRVESLSEIVLVGGATRMPIVRRAITRMFGRFPNQSVHADHAVALGAAVQAGLLMGDKALDEIRLSDVCPFTLGIDHVMRDQRGRMHAGIFSPIIERNTPIPTSRVNTYETMSDNQRLVELNIYQGEAREVVRNVKLGSLKVPVPPKPAGEVVVECRFTYDSNGVLEVDVTVPATGVTRTVVIMDEEDMPSAEQLELRRQELAELKIHPRDMARNTALTARATRCYEAFIGESRDRIGEGLANWMSVLDSQDPRAIAEAHVAFDRWLDELEGERFL